MKKYPSPWKRGGRKYYYFSYKIGNRFINKSTNCTTKNEAIAFITDFMDRLQVKTDTLKEYLAPFFTWNGCPHIRRLLDEQKNITRRYATICRQLLEKHILKDPIAEMSLSKIRRADILDFRSRLLEKTSPSTANHVIGLLKIAFREGVYREEIERDPAAGIGLVRYEKQERGILTEKELKTLFPTDSPGPWEDLQAFACFFVAATCGLRRGELLALRWGDIDFDQGILRIERAWKDTNEEGEPKWGQKRDIPLPARTMRIMKEWRRNSLQVLPGALVFCYGDGSRLGNTWWIKRWNEAMKAAKIPARARRLTPHSLRHTLNTILRDRGVSDEKIRAAMGWSNPKTQDGYTHFGTEHLQGQAGIIDKIFQ